MGDSITRAFQGGALERGSYRAELEKTFFALGVDYDFVGDVAFGPDRMIDPDVQAVSGYRTEQMVDEFAGSVARHQPDIVLLLAGTNHHWDAPEESHFQAKYLDLITMIHTNSPDSLIVASTVPPFGCCRTSRYWTPEFVAERNDVRIPAMNAAIVELAESLEFVQVVDLFPVIERSVTDLVVDDLVHLSRNGQAKLGALFFQQISSLEYGMIDAANIDRVPVESDNLIFDFDHSGVVDPYDRTTFITEYVRTSFGDSNLDGVFTSSDLVMVFQAGEYEDGVSGNSGWVDGDWDGDREFTTKDFVLALSQGIYDVPGVATAVPEPALLAVHAFLLPLLFLRRDCQR